MPVKDSYRRKILLVEDEPAVSSLITMLLETRGYDVITAASGQETFHKVSNNIDLIILDLLLPDMEGLEICHRLKSIERIQHIPIIILSGRDNSQDRIAGFRSGADDYLSKPFQHEELFARMDAILRRDIFIRGNEYSRQYEVIRQLRAIIDQELVIPHFQPIYSFKSSGILGLEVLSRPQIAGEPTPGAKLGT